MIQHSVILKLKTQTSTEEIQVFFEDNHAFHIAVIRNFWLKSVEDFLEIDYERISER
jgi:hypothetical protein